MHLLQKTICAVLIAIATTASATAAGTNTVSKTANIKTSETEFEDHKVKKGETLWGISQKYRTSVGEIMDCNRLPNEMVREGMTLKIPRRKNESSIKVHPAQEPEKIKAIATPIKPPTQKPTQNGMSTYTVMQDDTFYSIGKKNGVSMESIIKANPSVKPEQLHDGMEIFLPKSTQTKANNLNVESNDTQTKKPATESPAKPENKPITSVAPNKPKTSSTSEALVSSEPKKSDIVNKTTVTASKPVIVNTPELTPKRVIDDGIIRSYIVSTGEDENTISEAFGITKKQLLEYNRLSNSTNLKPGDEIMIPKISK